MTIVDVIVVSAVWSGHPVGFDLLTHGDNQFVAFYDSERRMTVASRRLGAARWDVSHPQGVYWKRRKRLSSTIAWDSHNYVTMAVDRDGYLHLAGNMHVDPLVYFRSARPFDASPLERVDKMVGTEENRCTYPRFMAGPKGELIFRYRHGSSGNGGDFYNIYDPDTRTWRRLLDKPLPDGQGRMNAYARMPQLGPDGWYHMIWMWRDTPDCATNHDISYARSPNLVDWETSAGKRLELPITLETGEVVDPVPVKGGMINSVQALGFDAQKRPVVTYHKYDVAGNTQAMNARLEGPGVWQRVQTSDWAHRWGFSGGGSVGAQVRLGSVTVREDGGLGQSYRHWKEGSGIWRLDEATLKPVGTYPKPPSLLPPEARKVTSAYPGMKVKTTSRVDPTSPAIRYVLRWETLGPNRDRPRDEGPPPSELKLFVIDTSDGE